MSEFGTLFVGTVGEGLWRSADGGATFTRLFNGLFIEADVRALAVHPRNRSILFAGTNCGLYRSTDGGDTWLMLNTGFGTGWPGTSGSTVWSIAILPDHQNIVFAGLCPPAIYRSEDGGDTWAHIDADLAPECGVILYPRVTCIVPDPVDADTVWAGVEIDGVRRSRDRGVTWERLGEGLSSQDIHSIAVIPGNPKTILAATNSDQNISQDDGATWKSCGVKDRFDWGYCRGIAQKSDDPNVLFQGNGNGPPGSEGAIQISRDGGRNWNKADLPHQPNSTIWTFATTPSDSKLIAAASVSGYIYLSRDAGETWTKLQREFGEIRSLALV